MAIDPTQKKVTQSLTISQGLGNWGAIFLEDYISKGWLPGP